MLLDKIKETRTNYQFSKKSKKNYKHTIKDVHDIKMKLDDDLKINKYSGYVYDAVWLYANALHTLINKNDTSSYIHNLHSEQSVTEFVNIIKKMDFEGVSGRINFKNRPSRLSNVRILQWLKNTSNDIFENDIGLYSPDYGELENNNPSET